MIEKSLLQGRKHTIRPFKALNGCDVLAVGLECQHQTGINRPVADQNSTSPALSLATADLYPGQAKSIAQKL